MDMSGDPAATAFQCFSPFVGIGSFSHDQFYGNHPSVPCQSQEVASYGIPLLPYANADQQLLHLSHHTMHLLSAPLCVDAEIRSMENINTRTSLSGKILMNQRNNSGATFSDPLQSPYSVLTTMMSNGKYNQIRPQYDHSQNIASSCAVQKKGESRTQQANGLLFTSLEEAVAAIPLPTWQCPANDNTIPSTDEARQEWVTKLLNAMNNVKDVNDKQGLVFKKHWFDSSRGTSDFYSVIDKEIICWDILDLAERLHRQGPHVLNSFDPTFWVQAAKTRGWTFQKRIQSIVDLLMYSKSRCEKLLGGAGLQPVVTNPIGLKSATKGNLKQNRKRQALLEAGRAAKRQRTI